LKKKKNEPEFIPPKIDIHILLGGKRALDPKNAPWRPKLLEDLNGSNVLDHVIQAAKGITAAKVRNITGIISSRYEEVLRRALKPHNVRIAVQEQHRGTADAIWQAIQQGEYPETGEVDHVLILMGDQPLVTSKDLDQFIRSFSMACPQTAGIISFRGNRRDPILQKCGVVIRRKGKFIDLQPRIPIPSNTKTEELHAGPYIFNAGWLRGLLSILGKYQDKFPAHVPEFHLYDALLAAVEYWGVHIYRSRYRTAYYGVDNFMGLEITQSILKRRRHQP